MALSLRNVKPNLLKILTRQYRPYSAQIDGLRLDENGVELSPREELSHYQELVTDKVSAILQEGKRLANSVRAINSTTSTVNQNVEELDLGTLITKANQLQAQVAANVIVPYFHFHDSSASKPEKTVESAAVSLQHRLLIQSYSYAGNNYSHDSVNVEDLLANGEVLDCTFGVDTTLTLPPHLLAYVRENTRSVSLEDHASADTSPNELFQLELESCQPLLFKQLQPHSSADKSEVVKTEKGSSEQPGSPKDEDDMRPSKDQLIKVHELMTKELPKILLSRHDYRLYRPDVIYENNFYEKPYITKGIAQYVVEIARLRVWAHFKYANVKMGLLKSTIEEEEGTVTFHWRMSGVPQLRAFMFWKFLPWTYKDTVRKESDFHEGISTFYVDNTGLIAKHKLDRMMLDREFETVKPRRSLRERFNKMFAPKPAIGAAYKSNDR